MMLLGATIVSVVCTSAIVHLCLLYNLQSRLVFILIPDSLSLNDTSPEYGRRSLLQLDLLM